jgi:hypothetical protein
MPGIPIEKRFYLRRIGELDRRAWPIIGKVAAGVVSSWPRSG